MDRTLFMTKMVRSTSSTGHRNYTAPTCPPSTSWQPISSQLHQQGPPPPTAATVTLRVQWGTPHWFDCPLPLLEKDTEATDPTGTVQESEAGFYSSNNLGERPVGGGAARCTNIRSYIAEGESDSDSEAVRSLSTLRSGLDQHQVDPIGEPAEPPLSTNETQNF
ncbi:Potassium voltage-gated channel subfamily KQT member 2 [Oryzias melastigma]|uniref:Potassium voltage-gated channel subfamily KQT member 2 n=1 Tax=Oryzias melastigma TaxID=30732 RepID=A0A834FC42_ORYME|nr:Potassium voltage-gated channel subfamily KQT member 2 [Oryzias melastigma]